MTYTALPAHATTKQHEALADFIHGDGIVGIEDEHNGAFLIICESAPHMIVERDGTILDESGEKRS